MSERLAGLFPFAIAVVLPPAGLLLGAVELRQDWPDPLKSVRPV